MKCFSLHSYPTVHPSPPRGRTGGSSDSACPNQTVTFFLQPLVSPAAPFQQGPRQPLRSYSPKARSHSCPFPPLLGVQGFRKSCICTKTLPALAPFSVSTAVTARPAAITPRPDHRQTWSWSSCRRSCYPTGPQERPGCSLPNTAICDG